VAFWMLFFLWTFFVGRIAYRCGRERGYIQGRYSEQIWQYVSQELDIQRVEGEE
jgi:hypothetical protein